MTAAPRKLPRQGAPDPGEFARRLVAERREREALLGPDLFGEPVWDMLLDLFAAHEEGRTPSVSSLCIAANVPPTTALRWIAAMEEAGKLTREADARDKRRINVRMTPQAAEQMRRLLLSWMEDGTRLRRRADEQDG